MMQGKNIFYSLIFFPLFFILPVWSGYLDYAYPSKEPSFSNFGGLGILKNPNARFHENGTLAFTWTHDYPYLRGSIVAYPFDWLETSFQYTDVNNQLYSDVRAFSGDQSLKDKSFDAKLRIFKETDFIPELALGFRDLGGTGIFSSEYIVASKFIKNTDFTVGLGWGNLSNFKVSNPLNLVSDRFQDRGRNLSEQGGEFNFNSFFTGDPGIFMGVEYFFKNRSGMRLKLEVDGTDYNFEGPKPLKQSSKFNTGLVIPFKSFHLKLSYIKGNRFSFGFSYSPQLGRKNSGRKKFDPYVPVQNADIVKTVTSKNSNNLYRASLRYMGDRNLFLQMADVDEESKTYKIAYSQQKFSSYPQSLGRALRFLDEISPDVIENFEVINLNGRIGIYSAKISRDDLRWSKDKLDTKILAKNINLEPYKLKKDEFEFKPKTQLPAVFYQIGPDLRTQIGGPDGFFFGDLRINLTGELIPLHNLSILFEGSIGITDNMDRLKLPSDSILPHVRTDIVQYLKQSREKAINRLQFNYFMNPYKDIYAKISGGLFESMFGGFGGEILYRPFYSNFALGIEAWQVKQREYDQLFKFRDYNTVTGHTTIYYREPKSRVLLRLSGGRYLAKDSGITVDLSRRFRSGLIMGIYASLTDISKEEFGEGSFDKGFYFWIPIQTFYSTYKKGNTGWGLRPITRDGAQRLIHGYHLYGVTDQSSSYNIRKDFADFYD